MQCAILSLKYVVSGVQFQQVVSTVKSALLCVQCGLCNVQFVAYRLLCAVFCVLCVVCSL